MQGFPENVTSLLHELNQPLTSILGNAQAAMQLLESKSLDARELGEILGDIINDDRRASEIVELLRELLRRDVQKRAVDPGALT
jgi:two-component system sensor kinase FixL